MKTVLVVIAALLLCLVVSAQAALFGRGGTGACPAPCLPRIAWEGGPAWWSQWSTTQAAGWTNPSFFPIGVWVHFTARPITTQSQIDPYKNSGVNGFYPLSVNNDVTLVRSNGMWTLPTRVATGTLPANIGAESVGYFVDDEDDAIYYPGYNGWNGDFINRSRSQCVPAGSNCGYTVMSSMKGMLPVDGRPYAANWTAYMAAPSYIPMTPTQQSDFVNGYTNMLTSLDYYWYSNAQLSCGAYQGGAEALGLPFSQALTNQQCYRASNYGAAVRKLRAVDAMDGQLVPVWGFVETGCVNCGAGDPIITGAQLQGAVWNMIIAEARGILYFDVNLAGACTGEPIQLNCGGIRPYVSAVNAQIAALAPVINTQSYVWTFNSLLDTMVKRGPDNKWYVFAMQAQFNDTGTYTFTLPSWMTSSTATATVLNESRTVAISAGTFNDTFAAEYSYHIYQVTP